MGDGGLRWENARAPADYVSGAVAGRPAESWREPISPRDRLEERVLCGLRLAGGLAVDAALEAAFGAGARRMADRGLLRVERGLWIPTRTGRALLNALITGVVVT